MDFGEEVFICEVKKILLDVIEVENKCKLLMDEYFVKLFNDKGYNIVCRMIVKYCE